MNTLNSSSTLEHIVDLNPLVEALVEASGSVYRNGDMNNLSTSTTLSICAAI